jgi:hypothetical protein
MFESKRTSEQDNKDDRRRSLNCNVNSEGLLDDKRCVCSKVKELLNKTTGLIEQEDDCAIRECGVRNAMKLEEGKCVFSKKNS